MVPSAPGRVLASRNTKTSVVVQWDRPKHEENLLGYYVDCCVAGTNLWEPCNHKPIGYNRYPPITQQPSYCYRGRALDVVWLPELERSPQNAHDSSLDMFPLCSHMLGCDILKCWLQMGRPHHGDNLSIEKVNFCYYFDCMHWMQCHNHAYVHNM